MRQSLYFFVLMSVTVLAGFEGASAEGAHTGLVSSVIRFRIDPQTPRPTFSASSEREGTTTFTEPPQTT
jgi:hypothetical protein